MERRASGVVSGAWRERRISDRRKNRGYDHNPGFSVPEYDSAQPADLATDVRGDRRSVHTNAACIMTTQQFYKEMFSCERHQLFALFAVLSRPEMSPTILEQTLVLACRRSETDFGVAQSGSPETARRHVDVFSVTRCIFLDGRRSKVATPN